MAPKGASTFVLALPAVEPRQSEIVARDLVIGSGLYRRWWWRWGFLENILTHETVSNLTQGNHGRLVVVRWQHRLGAHGDVAGTL